MGVQDPPRTPWRNPPCAIAARRVFCCAYSRPVARVRELCIRECLPKVISCSSRSLVAVCRPCFDCDGRLAGAERRVPTMRSGHALTHLRCEGKAGAFLLHLRCGMNDDRLEPRAKPCIAIWMELRPPRPHHRASPLPFTRTRVERCDRGPVRAGVSEGEGSGRPWLPSIKRR